MAHFTSSRLPQTEALKSQIKRCAHKGYTHRWCAHQRRFLDLSRCHVKVKTNAIGQFYTATIGDVGVFSLFATGRKPPSGFRRQL